MKHTIAAFLFLSSVAHAACPALQGEYTLCRSKKNILIEGALSVKKIEVPGNTFYEFKLSPEGSSEVETTFFPANGIPVKDSWVSSTGVKHERTISARCLADNLLQVRTQILAYGGTLVEETSQYYMQGEELRRISRGKVGELKYTDFLDCTK